MVEPISTGVAIVKAAPAIAKVGAMVFKALPFILSSAQMIGSLYSGRAAAAQQRRIGRRLGRDAIQRGEEDVFSFRGDAERLMGTQRANLAGANIDITQGSAKILRDQTSQFVERDVKQLRMNAARESRALRMGANAQAAQFRSQAFSNALTAAGTVISSAPDAWDAYKRRRG